MRLLTQKKTLASSAHLTHYSRKATLWPLGAPTTHLLLCKPLVNVFLLCYISSAIITACRAGNPGLPATCESVPISGQRNDEKAINTKVLRAEWFSIHCIFQKSLSHTDLPQTTIIGDLKLDFEITRN